MREDSARTILVAIHFILIGIQGLLVILRVAGGIDWNWAVVLIPMIVIFIFWILVNCFIIRKTWRNK